MRVFTGKEVMRWYKNSLENKFRGIDRNVLDINKKQDVVVGSCGDMW
jgi:hypothetical protein